ncbi:MAG TPA: RAMP superfamily CRISPR-associated protein [Wenzhouxiangella sp.]|nr:RAMP superfamily CRISPR-associated protein [Wenzhouxiangella sp.]
MEIIKCQLRFLTPAFVGDANQDGVWRTPPIKALLRQWWRVAYAAENNFAVNVADMRHREGMLFGHAWLEDDKQDGQPVAGRKSAVRIRLGHPVSNDQSAWTKGTQQGVAPMSTGLTASYSWFGLIERGPDLPDKSAISVDKPVESRRLLQLAVPGEHAKDIKVALSLISQYGTTGSRSRGGWGSILIDEWPDADEVNAGQYSRNLSDCLDEEWAMSFATDKQGLMLWQSKDTFSSWDKAMSWIGRQRKMVRSELKVDKNLREMLGFAEIRDRLPSPLRWKVCPAKGNELRVLAFALPHAIPSVNKKNFSKVDLQRGWNIIAGELDKTLARVSE